MLHARINGNVAKLGAIQLARCLHLCICFYAWAIWVWLGYCRRRCWSIERSLLFVVAYEFWLMPPFKRFCKSRVSLNSKKVRRNLDWQKQSGKSRDLGCFRQADDYASMRLGKVSRRFPYSIMAEIPSQWSTKCTLLLSAKKLRHGKVIGADTINQNLNYISPTNSTQHTIQRTIEQFELATN